MNQPVFADDHDAADPGQIKRQAGAQYLAAAPDASRGANIGRRFQHRLDRRDDFALGVGAVLREICKFLRGKRDLLAAGILERTDPVQHQRSHQDQRQQCEPRADSEKLLEFRSFAVETDA